MSHGSAAFLRAILALVALALAAPGVRAALPGAGAEAPAAAPAVPAGATPEEIDAILSTATDAQARALLARELRARAERERGAKRTAHGGFGVALVEFRKRVEAFAVRLRGHAATLREGFSSLPESLPDAIGSLGGAEGLGPKLRDLAVFLAIGIAAQALVRRRLRPARVRIEAGAVDGMLARLRGAATRLLIELVPVAVFSAVTLGLAAAWYDTGDEALDLVIAYVAGAIVVLVAYAASRTVLSPFAPALRLVPVADAGARFAHRWIVTLTLAGTIVWLTAGLVILTGVPMPVHLALVVTSGAAMALLAMPMILSGRRIVADAILGAARFELHGHGPGPVRRGIAGSWHWIAAGYVVVVYLVWSYNMLSRSPTAVWAGIGSVLLVIAIPLLDRAAAAFAGTVLGLEDAEQRAERVRAADRAGDEEATEIEVDGESLSAPMREAEATVERRRRYAAIAHGAARFAIGLVAALALLQLWGFNVLGLAGPQAEAAFWASMLSVAVTLVVAWLAWQLVKALIDPHLAADGPAVSMGDEDHVAPRTRAETLLPLLRTTALVLLVVFTTMICLANLGVDIGPLLAGAGVVGLAIGFGAQALVKDIVSGIFFLVDDAFRVGEYIEFGDLRGEVEAITLRSLKLRHHRGAVHTVPFGELRSVTNYNRDWVIYKMEFRMPMDTDVEKVRKIVKKIGQELLDDPEEGHKFLQPLKSQGIHRMEENAIIVRTKFMCKPREQWMIRRHAYRMMKERFAENGIEFAPRTVKVTGGSGEQPPDTGVGAGGALLFDEEARSSGGAAGA